MSIDEKLKDLQEALDQLESAIVRAPVLSNESVLKLKIVKEMFAVFRHSLEVPVDLEKEAKTFLEIQDWVMLPSERRSDPQGGPYDVKLSDNRRNSKQWISVDVLQGKVVVDRQQLEDKLKEYQKIDKSSSSKLWVEGARWVIEFIEKELLSTSKETEK